MVLDDAKRDNTLAKWKSSFHRSIICEVGKLEDRQKISPQSDIGRLLAGAERPEEVYFFATLAYIREWCLGVEAGIQASVAELYAELQNHAEEMFTFLRIKGAVSVVLDYMGNRVTQGYAAWNLHALTNVKTIVLLKDKEERVKGRPL